jgi:hypothetical protein
VKFRGLKKHSLREALLESESIDILKKRPRFGGLRSNKLNF